MIIIPELTFFWDNITVHDSAKERLAEKQPSSQFSNSQRSMWILESSLVARVSVYIHALYEKHPQG